MSRKRRVSAAKGTHLKQVTQDHSLVAEMVREGDLAAAEERSHRARNVITRAIGIEAEVAVDHWWIDPAPGQVLLACSDGLTNEVAVEDLEAILRTAASPQQAVDALIQHALDAGARDNVSAVAVFVDAVTVEAATIEEDTNPRGDLSDLAPAAPALIEVVPGAGPAVPVAPAPVEGLVTGVPSVERDGRGDGVPAELGSDRQGG